MTIGRTDDPTIPSGADDNAEAIPVGEIGQAHAPRLLDLWEDDVEVGAVQGLPKGIVTLTSVERPDAACRYFVSIR
jgi:hypothetical protein